MSEGSAGQPLFRLISSEDDGESQRVNVLPRGRGKQPPAGAPLMALAPSGLGACPATSQPASLAAPAAPEDFSNPSRSGGTARLLQPAGQAPPDVTVSVPLGGANGSYAPPAANGSHLGDPEGNPGGGATLRSELSGWASFGGLSGSAAASGAGGWRSALRKLFSRGHATEAAGVNHTYTSEERARLKQFQSIDYLAPSSRVYRQWLAAQPWGRYWDRWLMMALSGVAVGLVGFSLHFLIHALSFTKYHGTR